MTPLTPNLMEKESGERREENEKKFGKKMAENPNPNGILKEFEKKDPKKADQETQKCGQKTQKSDKNYGKKSAKKLKKAVGGAHLHISIAQSTDFQPLSYVKVCRLY